MSGVPHARKLNMNKLGGGNAMKGIVRKERFMKGTYEKFVTKTFGQIIISWPKK